MEVQCPNCATKLTVASLAGPPTPCLVCEKNVYFPHEGRFPAIVPITFPSQASPAVELIPFFHVSESHMAAELQGEQPGTTRPLNVMSNEQAQALTDELHARSPEAHPNGADGQPQVPDTSQPPLPPQELDEPQILEPIEVEAEPSAQEPAVQPAIVNPGEENLELLSLAGGSFAAALTPPPAAAKPQGPPSLQSMSTLGPPPWDTVAPPPIGPKDGKDEQWSVSNGPPPLAKGSNGGPPAIPKASEEDQFAAALGLPQMPDRPDKAPPPAVVVPASTTTDTEEDGDPLKKFKKNLIVFGGIAIVAAAVIAIIVATAANKPEEKPIAPVPDTPPAVSGAVAPNAVSGATVAPEDPKKTTEKPIDPQKRAAALEHYSKGNKYYLQRKYTDALAEYKRALEADPSFALAHRGLGVTYASQNKRDKAIESYKAYLRLAPDAKDAGQVKAIIQKAESER